MANRTNNLTYIKTLVLVATVLLLPLMTQAFENEQLANPPASGEQAQTAFSIEANDQEILDGTVYFIISSLATIEDQPIVFILSVDGSIVRQISLTALTTARRHWQSALDTAKIPNGSYRVVVGKLNNKFQLEIWHDVGWKQFLNLTSPKSEPLISKLIAVPVATTTEPVDVSTTTSSISADTTTVVTPPAIIIPEVRQSLPEVTAYCQDQGIIDAGQCSVLELANRYPECRTAGLWQLADCQQYLSRIYFAQACEPEQITNPEQCRQYWQQAAGKHLSCQVSAEQCSADVIQHVGELVAHWVVSQKSEAVLTGLVGKVISFKTLQQGLSAHGIATDSSMIQSLGFDDRPGLKIAPAQPAMIVARDRAVVSSWPAVMLVDSDADGLSDDAEIRYGTEKDQPDTDGDSYLDGAEVEHGFNPLGSGPLVAPIEAVDKLIFSGQTWQQPLQSGDRDQQLNFSEIKSFPNAKGLIISGQAQTLQTITVFIYGSQIPLVVSARADEQGLWTYYLSYPLLDGRYTMYVTQMNKDGEIMGKSEARVVYIKNGHPVTPAVYVQEQPKVLGIDFTSLPSSPLILQIIAGVVLVGGLLFFIGWLGSRKR